MRIYVSGPMTGLPASNYPAFFEATKQLRSSGHDTVSPAEIPAPSDPTWENWMRQSLQAMLTCDEVVLLPEWHMSVGARLEQNLAAQLRMKCTPLKEFLTTKGK